MTPEYKAFNDKDTLEFNERYQETLSLISELEEKYKGAFTQLCIILTNQYANSKSKDDSNNDDFHGDNLVHQIHFEDN